LRSARCRWRPTAAASSARPLRRLRCLRPNRSRVARAIKQLRAPIRVATRAAPAFRSSADETRRPA
jgi:hypothetical protein